MRSLQRAGFSQPSPVQQSAVPLGRFGADLIVQACCRASICVCALAELLVLQAKSGTGKTVTFGIIILDALSAALAAPQALVVEPTREVALQVQRTIAALCKELPLQARRVFRLQGVNALSDAHFHSARLSWAACRCTQTPPAFVAVRARWWWAPLDDYGH